MLSTRIAHYFFFNDTATTEIYTLSLHDALPIFQCKAQHAHGMRGAIGFPGGVGLLPIYIVEIGMDMGIDEAGHRSEEHTSELQSLRHLVCRLLLEKKKKKKKVIKS